MSSAPFLQQIAQQVIQNFERDASKLTIVLPSKRSGLFLQAHFKHLVQTPLFLPRITTMDKWLGGIQKPDQPALLRPDVLQQIAILYGVYKDCLNSGESFADFYQWGEMLLQDFNDLDKSLADAELLFANLHDQQQLDQRFEDVLEPEQREELLQIWGNIRSKRTSDQKERYLQIWRQLPTIYTTFHERLRKRNFITEGNQYRQAANIVQEWLASQRPDLEYWYVGLNEMSQAELKVLTVMASAGSTRLWLDAEESWANEHSWLDAGHFLKKIMRNPELAAVTTILDVWRGKPTEQELRVVSVSQTVVQAKVAGPQLEKMLAQVDDPTKVAVLMPDTSMLFPVLQALPLKATLIDGSVQELEPNIAMGFPFRQTSWHGLLHNWVELRKNERIREEDGAIVFYNKHVLSLLTHPNVQPYALLECSLLQREIAEQNLIYVPVSKLVASGNPLLVALFSTSESLKANNTSKALDLLAIHDLAGKATDLLDTALLLVNLKQILALLSAKVIKDNATVGRNSADVQYLAQVISSINKFEDVVLKAGIAMDLSILWKLLRNLLDEAMLSFVGEPLEGLQLLGMLESRCLDFEQLVILDVNEGILPSKAKHGSFIPFNLRRLFGLPTKLDQAAAQAYHFFRIIRRAKQVTFFYTAQDNDRITGEPSRFLMQLKHGLNVKLLETQVTSKLKTQDTTQIAVASSPSIRQKLLERFTNKDKDGRTLDPTAINAWLTCKLKFYNKYVLGLRTESEVEEDPANSTIGQLVHHTLNELYAALLGQKGNRTLEATDKDWLLAHASPYLNIAIKELKLGDDQQKLRGQSAIAASAAQQYINWQIESDCNQAPFEILELEGRNKELTWRIPVEVDGQQHNVHLGGAIDRVDMRKDGLYVIDFKTGKVDQKVNQLADLLTQGGTKLNDKAYQILHYAELYTQRRPSALGHLPVKPNLIPLRNLGDASYEPKAEEMLVIGDSKNKQDVKNYDAYRDEFVSGVKQLVQDIFSADQMFEQSKEMDKHCKYCDFLDLCQRRHKIKEF